jgi:hypothetical protein
MQWRAAASHQGPGSRIGGRPADPRRKKRRKPLERTDFVRRAPRISALCLHFPACCSLWSGWKCINVGWGGEGALSAPPSWHSSALCWHCSPEYQNGGGTAAAFWLKSSTTPGIQDFMQKTEYSRLGFLPAEIEPRIPPNSCITAQIKQERVDAYRWRSPQAAAPGQVAHFSKGGRPGPGLSNRFCHGCSFPMAQFP